MKYVILAFLSITILACNNEASNDAPTKSSTQAYENEFVAPLTAAIAQDPKNAALYFDRSMALDKINEEDLAVLDLKKAIDLDMSNLKYQESLGFLYASMNDPKAVTTFEKLMVKTPNDPTTKINLTRMYIQFKKLSEADKQLKDLNRLHPNHPSVLYYQGQLAAAQKDTINAIALTEASIKLAPQAYEGYEQLGILYAATKPELAIKNYEKLYTLDTLDPAPYYQIGKIYEQHRQLEKAKIAYKQSMFVDKSYEPQYLANAAILIQQDSLEKAGRLYNMLIDLMPNSAGAYLGKANIAYKQNKIEEARQMANKALIFDPNLKAAISLLDKLNTK